VADWLGAQEGVSNVHDLHIWALSTTSTALAVHPVWQGDDPPAEAEEYYYAQKEDLDMVA